MSESEIKAAAERRKLHCQAVDANDFQRSPYWREDWYELGWLDLVDDDLLLLADTYLALISRTPTEAAKAAAEEITRRANEIADSISDDISIDEMSQIIQRHTPPANERLRKVCEAAMRIESLWCPQASVVTENDDEIVALRIMRENFKTAIDEARAALGEKP